MIEKIAEIIYIGLHPKGHWDKLLTRQPFLEIARQILDTLAGGELGQEDWEQINKETGVDVIDLVVNLDKRYTPMEQAGLIVDRCNRAVKLQAIRIRAQCEKEIGEIKEELEATYEAYEVVVDFMEQEIGEILDILSELVDLMEDVRTGDYVPDSFTTQPSKSILHKYQALKKGGGV